MKWILRFFAAVVTFVLLSPMLVLLLFYIGFNIRISDCSAADETILTQSEALEFAQNHILNDDKGLWNHYKITDRTEKQAIIKNHINVTSGGTYEDGEESKNLWTADFTGIINNQRPIYTLFFNKCGSPVHLLRMF
ncbi:hypothetical protein WJT86_00805 [Microvirga sp. W0021]|uniref:Uncharacterized protein n=1 Tax=Hohaiivirga grylli TaxID=3133970 RepID=A0ABV0BH47_9HYPH